MEALFSHMYTGQVVDNSDPEANGRVKVRVPGLDDAAAIDDLPWARVMSWEIGQGQGPRQRIKTGVTVCVMFDRGDPDRPIILGEVQTILDTVNTSKEDYVAGAEVKIVEGNQTTQVQGTRIVSGILDHLVDFSGRVARRGRVVEDVATGSRNITAGAETKTVEGNTEHRYNGLTTLRFGSELALSVLNGFKNSIVGVYEVLTVWLPGVDHYSILTYFGNQLFRAIVPGGIKIRVTSPIPDPTELLDIAKIEVSGVPPAINLFVTGGIVRVGTNVTQGVAATPVTTTLHTHIGNLGLPTSPVVPPLGVSATLWAE